MNLQLLFLLVISCLLSMPTAPAENRPDARERPLRIVTSFLPMQAHTLAIVGDKAEVVQLLEKDTGPHEFQLTPGDVRKIADADLFVINGAGLESWLERLLKSAGKPDLRVVDTSAGIDLRESGEPLKLEGDTSHDHSDAHEHDHEHGPHCQHDGENPHVWLDPVFAMQQTRAILQALVEADPANADAYRANAERYLQRLADLDTRFREVLKPLPNKRLLTFHDAFPYFARRYGLDYVGYIESVPEQEPTPRRLASLVNLIRENQIGVIFAEKGYPQLLFQRLAEQTGARISELDTLEIGKGEADSYLARMEANLAALKKAFTAPAK